MLQPKRTKYRKQQKGRNRGLALRGSKVSFGDFGLKAVARAPVTSRQIEAARRAMTRYTRRGGKIFIRIFPDKYNFILLKSMFAFDSPKARTRATSLALDKSRSRNRSRTR